MISRKLSEESASYRGFARLKAKEKPVTFEGVEKPMDLHDDFSKSGFLSAGIAQGIGQLRAENADWFKLADDVNSAMMRAVHISTNAVKTNSMMPEAIAVRILLRSCGTFQGVVLLTERGLVAESRTMARSLIEDAFGIAALTADPAAFLAVLKEDSDASRRLQGKFILAEELIAKGATRDKLQAAMDELGKPDTMSPKAVAKMGPMTRMYLPYQRLSDDAAHLSAKSLDRHVRTDAERSGWSYKWGPADAAENAATLHHAILAALPIGIGIGQLLGKDDIRAEFSDLTHRYDAMPPVAVI